MALTKVNRGGLNTGIADSSDATFLTATSSEGATFAGTLAVTGVHTIGNNAIYTSDSGAVTQNLVQSLVKGWLTLHGTGTIAVIDSFNASSVSDSGTGVYAISHNNNYTSGGYSAPSSSSFETGGIKTTSYDRSESESRSGGSSGHNLGTVRVGSSGGGDLDSHFINVAYAGDLA